MIDRRSTLLAVWAWIGLLACALWAMELFNGRRVAVTGEWNGDVAANVIGMAVVGGCSAVVAGGLFGLARPWRALGVVAAVAFAALAAVFALLSGGGGARCEGVDPCEVSAYLRYGGLAVILGCCSVAALASRVVADRR